MSPVSFTLWFGVGLAESLQIQSCCCWKLAEGEGGGLWNQSFMSTRVLSIKLHSFCVLQEYIQHTAWLQIHTCDLLTRLTHLHQRRLTCVTILQSSGSGPVMFPLCSYNTLAERTGIWHQLLYLPAVDRQRDTAGWLELFTLTHLHPPVCLVSASHCQLVCLILLTI